jgi:hypothetical protein
VIFSTFEELEEKYPDRVYRRGGFQVILNKTTDENYIAPFVALRALVSESQEVEIFDETHCEHCF